MKTAGILLTGIIIGVVAASWLAKYRATATPPSGGGGTTATPPTPPAQGLPLQGSSSGFRREGQ